MIATPCPCPCTCDISAQALAQGRRIRCPECGAEYEPPRPSALPRAAAPPQRPVPRPRTLDALLASSPRVSPAADLEALALCLTALTGSASPIAKIPGGQSEGSPAERVQGLLGAALRAQRRLAWMRQTHPREVLALLATYVHAGAELRRLGPWLETVDLALVVTASRPGSGPDARAARAGGVALLARAEAMYDQAEEQPTDGRWLPEDLDAVSRAIEQLAAGARSVARGRRRGQRPVLAPRECPSVELLAEDLCAARSRGGRVFGRAALTARCQGRRVPGVCARTALWVVRDGRIVVSPLPARGRRRERGESKTWRLLVAASDGAR